MRDVITRLAQTKRLNIVMKGGVITEKKSAAQQYSHKIAFVVSGARGADESSGGVDVPLNSGVWIRLNWGSFRPACLGDH